MRLQSRLDISNTLRVSLSPTTPSWGHRVAGKQAQGSHWCCIMMSWIIISLSQCNDKNNRRNNEITLKPRPQPTPAPWFMERLPSTKPPPDAKEVGDCCSVGLCPPRRLYLLTSGMRKWHTNAKTKMKCITLSKSEHLRGIVNTVRSHWNQMAYEVLHSPPEPVSLHHKYKFCKKENNYPIF